MEPRRRRERRERCTRQKKSGSLAGRGFGGKPGLVHKRLYVFMLCCVFFLGSPCYTKKLNCLGSQGRQDWVRREVGKHWDASI